MKVFHEYLIQLTHRVNTLHREKKKVVGSPSEKGQGNIVDPGQRTGSTALHVC